MYSPIHLQIVHGYGYYVSSLSPIPSLLTLKPDHKQPTMMRDDETRVRCLIYQTPAKTSLRFFLSGKVQSFLRDIVQVCVKFAKDRF